MKESPESNTKYKDGVNRNARLIIRNIPFKATEESLKEHFSRFGSVEEVKLLRKPDGKLVGCGFVHFTHVPMANAALAATHKKPFLDRPLSVAWAVPKHKYGEKEQSEDPERNVKHPKREANDKVVEVKDEDTEEGENKQKNKTRVNRNARLIIRNVSFKATEESLKEHFQPYGEILEVKLLKKPDGKLVGCAFVHFKNVPMAKKALLNTNMKAFLGRPISVDWAVAKDKYMQHIVNQQVDMESEVKKEESDSNDDGPPVNISNDDLKQEVKSESDDDSESEDKKDVKASDDESEDSDKASDDDEDEDDEEDDEEDDAQSQTSTQAERKRTQLNDAEDGLTVFLTNIPFSVDDHQLRQFVEKTAPVSYALVCVDRLTEHSKGSGFVKFTNQDDADKFLALPTDQLKLEGQVLQVKPALNRDNLQKSNDKKQPKDNRNLYLVKEGVVVAGTKAAEGVSASDMAKRLALERSKTQMLKNLNRFVSRYRLVVSNLPSHVDDARLRRLCSPSGAVTECRVMRDLRAPTGTDGKHPCIQPVLARGRRSLETAMLALWSLNKSFASCEICASPPGPTGSTREYADIEHTHIIAVSNLPSHVDDARLRRLCSPSGAVTECRVMRDLRAPTGTDGKHPSKAYGFVMFMKHEDALSCLRKLNNNPDVFDKNNRPIVSFSIEDRTALNARKKRLEKSIANNPLANKQPTDNKNNNKNNAYNEAAKNKNNANNEAYNNRKRKGQQQPDESYNKKKRFDNSVKKWENNNNQGKNNYQGNKNKKWQNKSNQEEIGKFVRLPRNDDVDNYAGLTAKEGAQHKLRSSHKLRAQADIHRQQVKMEKKQGKHALRMKKAARERVKQPKQKINKNPGKKNKRKKFKPTNIKDILK